MTAPLGYVLEAHDFANLQAICKALFGDGTALTPDQRRDLANLMHVALSHAVPYLADQGKST